MDLFKVGTFVLVLSALLISCSESALEQPSTTSGSGTPSSETGASQTTTSRPTESTTTSRSTESTSTSAPTSQRVLVFHRTEGFRHSSIEAGIESLVELGASSGYQVVASDDPSVFSRSGLESFAVVVFLNTTGDVLDEAEEVSMEEFIGSGGGFVGIHSAADTEYDWEWYGGLVGAYFANHPTPQNAVVSITSGHPVVEGLPDEIERFDEWYNFRAPPGGDVTVLAVVDESTYEGGAMGSNHPIVWALEYEGGRAVYVGFGHTAESFEEPLVLTLLDNAIRWAGSLEPS